MSHKVITTIPNVRSMTVVKYKNSLHHDEVIEGVLSCEAPVKALIKNSITRDDPVEEVICLVSAEAGSPNAIISVDAELSSYDLFKRNISEYVQNELHCTIPIFTSVSYDIKSAEMCITDILSLLSFGDTVDIDVTSGDRTLATHLVLCLEAMVIQGVNLGNVVFAQFFSSKSENNPIRVINHVFDMIELINAINDFSRHGKALSLSGCFKKTDNSTLQNLCMKMSTFSSKLAICRVSGISNDIHGIWESLSDYAKLNLDDNTPMIEKMFQVLIPSIEKQFVQNDQNDTVVNLRLAKWCAERGMLQQALSLIRENGNEAMAEFGFLLPSERIKDIYQAKKARKELKKHDASLSQFTIDKLRLLKPNDGLRENDIVEVCTRQNGRDVWTIQNIESFEKAESFYVKKSRAVNIGYTVNLEESVLQDCIVLLYYLQFIRNAVMHAGEYEGKVLDYDGENLLHSLHVNSMDHELPCNRKEQEEILKEENIREALIHTVDLLLSQIEQHGREYLRIKEEKEAKEAEEERKASEEERKAADERKRTAAVAYGNFLNELNGIQEFQVTVPEAPHIESGFSSWEYGFEMKVIVNKKNAKQTERMRGLKVGDVLNVRITKCISDSHIILVNPVI